MADCGCSGGSTYLLYPCSGASDTGEITDHAARRLSRAGKGRMSCLAQIGADNKALIDAAERAAGLVAMDGCAQDCVRKMLEGRGLMNILHLRLSNIGLVKGKSPANDENFEKVVQAALKLMPATSRGDGGCCS